MTAKERLFLSLVQAGIFRIEKSGLIFNQKTGRRVGKGKAGDYHAVSFQHQGKIHTVAVHRMVFLYFSRETIPDGYIVNHIDGDKTNNSYENLERITSAENIQHAYDTGLSRKGEEHHFSAFTHAQVLQYRKLYRSKKIKAVAIAKQHKVSLPAVYKMLKGESYNDLHSFGDLDTVDGDTINSNRSNDTIGFSLLDFLNLVVNTAIKTMLVILSFILFLLAIGIAGNLGWFKPG